MPKSGTVRSQGGPVANVKRNCPRLFQSGCCITPNRCVCEFQFLHPFVNIWYIRHFFILVIHMGVKRFLIMVLICLFLVTNGVEHLPRGYWPFLCVLLISVCSSLFHGAVQLSNCWFVLILCKFSCNSKRHGFFVRFTHCKYFFLVCDLPMYF